MLSTASHEPVHGHDRELGEEEQQEEHKYFHCQEWHKFYRQLTELDVTNAADHIEHRAHGWGNNAYAQVQNEQQAKVIRIYACLGDQRIEHWGENQDIGRQIHDHADEEEKDVDAQ